MAKIHFYHSTLVLLGLRTFLQQSFPLLCLRISSKFQGFAKGGMSDSESYSSAESERIPDNNSSSESEDEEAIQIVRLDKPENHYDDTSLTLDDAPLLEILKSVGDKKICVISIVGDSRNGKSLLINAIINALESDSQMLDVSNPTLRGFRCKPGASSRTKGINIWNKPLLVDGDGEEIAVLLLDYEGINAETTTWQEKNILYGISLLVSSVLLINTSVDLSRFPFDWFQDIKGKYKKPIIQKVVAVVRDWTKLGISPYGFVNMQSLVKKSLSEPMKFNSLQSLTHDTVECFLFPFVGTKALGRNFDGSIADMSKDFVSQLKIFTEKLLRTDNLALKTFWDCPVTAKEYHIFFKSIVNYFGAPGNIDAFMLTNVMQFLQETAGKMKLTRGLQEYDKAMLEQTQSACEEFIEDDDLFGFDSYAKQRAVQAFEAFKLPKDLEKKWSTKLQDKLSQKSLRTKHENAQQRNQCIQSCIAKSSETLTDTLQRNLPFDLFANTTDETLFVEQSLFNGVLDDSLTAAEEFFFEELPIDLDDYEKMGLQDDLKKSLNAVLLKYRKENTKHEANAHRHAKSILDNISKSYSSSMGRFLERASNADSLALEAHHLAQMDKHLEDLSRLGIGNAIFREKCIEDVKELLNSLHEDIRLSSNSLIQDASKFADEVFHRYKSSVEHAANCMDDEELLQYHENEVEASLSEYAAKDPYPDGNSTGSSNRLKLQCAMQDYFKGVIQEKIMAEKSNRASLDEVVMNCLKLLTEKLEMETSDGDFVNEEMVPQILDNIMQKIDKAFRQGIKSIKLEASILKEQREALDEQIDNFIGDWKTKNKKNRTKIISYVQLEHANCCKQYEEKISTVLRTLDTTEDLETQHLILKRSALNTFLGSVSTKNTICLKLWESELSEDIEKMYKEIQEHFELLTKTKQLDVQTAMIHAKGKYDEEMTKLFRNNASGYFPDDVLLSKHNIAASNAVLLSAEKHKISAAEENQVKAMLFKAFKKHQSENEMIRKSFQNELTIGIDLGTTYCCVAAFVKGSVKTVLNTMGSNITPSYVNMKKDGKHVFGITAKKKAYNDPENTIYDAKRMIGREFLDKEIQADIKFWPFTVVDLEGKPYISVHGKEYPPEKISSELLKHLKKEAEEKLGTTVSKAVITVPAYFNDSQRHATKDAGEMAGIEVLGLLNEPTAAAIAYRLELLCSMEPRNILVYDLGGGTFDVSILRMTPEKLDVLTVGGDTHLGGEDFDQNLMNYCADEFLNSTNVDLFDGRESENKKDSDEAKRRLERLQLACEEAKKELSHARVTTISLDRLVPGHDLVLDVNKKTFEDINMHLFEKTINILDNCLMSAGLKKGDIDDVVLVGGSTRIPMVQTMLQSHFEEKTLSSHVHPDEAVAHGAALQAALLSSNPDAKIYDFVAIEDVIPMSLGIEIASGEIDILMPKNSKIPSRRLEEYKTFEDGQTACTVKIYEGEQRLAKHNKLLGSFHLKGIPPGPAGQETVDVTMKIDASGILSVEAMCRSTKNRNSITVNADKGRLTNAEKKRLADEN